MILLLFIALHGCPLPPPPFETPKPAWRIEREPWRRSPRGGPRE
jgi:hypothetical protein